MYRTGMFRQIFFPGGFSFPPSPPLNSNRLLIPGYQTKKLRGVMAAYLLNRNKHFCMLIFRVVSPSLTKKVYVLHKAGYNNRFDNMI